MPGSGLIRLINRGIIAKRGLLIRHRFMQDCTDDSKKITEWISENIRVAAAWYFLHHQTSEFPETNGKITNSGYPEVLNYAKKSGLNPVQAGD